MFGDCEQIVDEKKEECVCKQFDVKSCKKRRRKQLQTEKVEEISKFCLLQWKCDNSMATICELEEFLGRHKVDVALIQKNQAQM